jgi:electron transfer flavoprotein beta subunit
MKARKKPIQEKTVGDYGVDPAPRLKVLEVTAPEKRRSGTRVGSAAELVGKLRERGLI